MEIDIHEEISTMSTIYSFKLSHEEMVDSSIEIMEKIRERSIELIATEIASKRCSEVLDNISAEDITKAVKKVITTKAYEMFNIKEAKKCQKE